MMRISIDDLALAFDISIYIYMHIHISIYLYGLLMVPMISLCMDFYAIPKGLCGYVSISGIDSKAHASLGFMYLKWCPDM